MSFYNETERRLLVTILKLYRPILGKDLVPLLFRYALPDELKLKMAVQRDDNADMMALIGRLPGNDKHREKTLIWAIENHQEKARRMIMAYFNRFLDWKYVFQDLIPDDTCHEWMKKKKLYHSVYFIAYEGNLEQIRSILTHTDNPVHLYGAEKIELGSEIDTIFHGLVRGGHLVRHGLTKTSKITTFANWIKSSSAPPWMISFILKGPLEAVLLNLL